jgi:hypothetical protein
MDRSLLATVLGDTPESTVPSHMLRRGLCTAFFASRASKFAAVIQSKMFPEDVFAAGDSPELIWELLAEIEGWRRVSVRPPVAIGLEAIARQETGVSSAYDDIVYHTLKKSAPQFRDPMVRQLSIGDLPLLEAAAPKVQGHGFGDVLSLIDEGVIASAIVDGEIVASAYTEAVTDRHANLQVSTLEPWRGRAFATAAASIVAERIQDSGKIPVWSAKHDNYASLRVAHKLGFEEASRRTLINLQPLHQ